MELFIFYILSVCKFMLIVLSAAILIRCLRSMLSERYEPEVWAYIKLGEKMIPVLHWENIIGRGPSSDVRVPQEGISRVHAVIKRSDKGQWHIYDIFSKGGVWVDAQRVTEKGLLLSSGDVLNLGGNILEFYDITNEKHRELESSRTAAGGSISPGLTLVYLSLFQLFLLIEHATSAAAGELLPIAAGFATVAALQWLCYYVMRLMKRSGFEVETLAFYLSTLGMSVAASSTPEDMYKQALLLAVSVLLFLFNGWWLRNLRRTAFMRIPIAVAALALLAVNVLTSDAVFGARNWLEIGGFSFQPSELVKAAYIYVGAATLDSLYRRKNLYGFIAFSAVCVMALALIGDFGTALIFFVSFLVISFMRSGSIATVFLAVTGAGLAGFLAVSVKPYIAQRFAVWGHVWEDVYDKGYQQTRAMSAAAAGGLFGKGAGSGWLKDIFAANTDMVFALICEELGLVIALCMVLAVLALAFFAVRSAKSGRSAYYSIAACATVSMMMVQLALNVFGSLDILPFTGVTFPFVSRGGSSLISCWILMAYIKGADTRRDASFAVKPVKEIAEPEDDEEEEFDAFTEDGELSTYRGYDYINDENNWYILEEDEAD